MVKKKKKKKNTYETVPNIFEYTDITAINEFLEEKEANGLKFKGFDVGTGDFLFERCAPRKVKYSAVVFRYKEEVAYENRNGFIKMCEDSTSWQFVSLYKDELYIFRSEREENTEIMTDKEQALKITVRANIKRRLIKSILPCLSILLTIVNLNIVNTLSDLLSSKYIVVQYIPMLIATLIYIAAQSIAYLRWYKKSKHSINEGGDIIYRNFKQVLTDEKRKDIWVSLFFSIFFGFGFAVNFNLGWKYYIISLLGSLVFLLICGICLLSPEKRIEKRNKFGSILCILFIFVICAQSAVDFGLSSSDTVPCQYNEAGEVILTESSIPLTITDLGYDGTDIYNSVYGSSSFLAEKYSYHSSCDDEVLYYDIFSSKYQPLRERYIDEVFAEAEKYREGQVTIKQMKSGGKCEKSLCIYDNVNKGDIAYIYFFGDRIVNYDCVYSGEDYREIMEKFEKALYK